MAETLSDGTTTLDVLVIEFDTSRTVRNVLHEIIGSPEPAVTLRPAGARQGTLEVLTVTAAEALAVQSLLASAAVLSVTITGAPEHTMQCVAAGGSIDMKRDPQTQNVWIVSAQVQEVTP